MLNPRMERQRKLRLKPDSNKPEQSVRNVALGILARREHTRVELVRKLQAKGFSEEEIAAQIKTLVREGLQSDERYAENYVSMRRNRGYGPLKIKQELQQRGIAAELVEVYVEHGDQIWLDAAYRAYEKKFATNPVNAVSERAKRMRFLQSRGFTGDIIRKTFARFA